MLTQCRRIAALAVAFTVSCDALAAVTAKEAAILEDAARPGAKPPAAFLASDVASAMGKRADIDGLQLLIALRHGRGLVTYALALPEPPPPEVEALLLRHWEDRAIATPLVRHLKGFRNPQLVEMVFADVQALADWRATRRKNCKAVLWSTDDPSFRPDWMQIRATTHGVRWSYVCAGGEPDDPATDLDGRSRGRRFDREEASVEAIAHAGVLAIEQRLAPLLLPIALMPAVDRSRVTRGMTNLDFSPVRIPYSWLHLLQRRGHRLGPGDLAAMRDALPPPAAIPGTDDDARAMGRLVASLSAIPLDAGMLNRGDGTPPLIRALREEPGVVPDLLAQGAGQGGTEGLKHALLAACERPVPLPIFRLLLAQGADVNAVNGIGFTPAHACAKDCPACIKLIASKGGRLEDFDQVGRTPIAIAMSYRNLATVTALLEAGADPNRPDADGDSAYSIEAFGRAEPAFLELMKRHGARITVGQRARHLGRRLNPRNYIAPPH
ncbi:MAG: ankyrin repeat domain-containing protein [Usitatibacter sp.]